MRTGQTPIVKSIWVSLVVLSLGLFLLAIPLYFNAMREVCEVPPCYQFQLVESEALAWQDFGFSLDGYAAYTSFVAYLAFVACWLVGVGLYWRRPGSRIAVFVSFDFLLFPTIFLQAQLEPLAAAIPLIEMIIRVLQATGMGFLVAFYFLFPNGQFVPRWTRSATLIVALYCLALLFTSDVVAVFNLTTPLGRSYFWGFMVLMVIGLVSQIYRYRTVSSIQERQQTKWVLLGLAVVSSVTLAYPIWPLFFPTLREAGLLHIFYSLGGATLNVLTFLFFLGCLALSVLRYRLWDIDVIIRRTLQYTLVTGSLALVYFSVVVVLQNLVLGVTGQRSQAVIVISTLAIAALFNPLRRRIQAFIDRRFFRRKYSAEQVLAAFGATARDETDLDKLTAEILAVVEETMQPVHASMWLREKGAKHKA